MIWREAPSGEALAGMLAERLEGLVRDAIAARGSAVLALAGGRTPFPAYRELARRPLDWTRVRILPTDERWVGAGHAARNEVEMAAAFAAATGVRILPLVPPDATAPPDTGFAAAQLATCAAPFDAVLLGMGGDSHTASLFPHAAGLPAALDAGASEDAFVVTPDPLPPEAPYPRITLGLARLKRSRCLLLATVGAAKRQVLEEAMSLPASADRPIGLFLRDPDRVMETYWSP